jgi:hypothetical protein
MATADLEKNRTTPRRYDSSLTFPLFKRAPEFIPSVRCRAASKVTFGRKSSWRHGGALPREVAQSGFLSQSRDFSPIWLSSDSVNLSIKRVKACDCPGHAEQIHGFLRLSTFGFDCGTFGSPTLRSFCFRYPLRDRLAQIAVASRHFAAMQHFGCFRSEADMDRQAKRVGSIENDPARTLRAFTLSLWSAVVAAAGSARSMMCWDELLAVR